ncbi:MAG: GGDEF domain-containing protein, partial [Gemmatimonadota bacterium]
MYDEVTGLPDRHALETSLAAQFTKGRWKGRCSAVKVDIDGLAWFNRRHGRLGGDFVLYVVGKVLELHGGGRNMVGRFGSDEFVALLPGTGARRATSFAKRVTLDVLDQFGEAGSTVTVSCGVATRDGSMTHFSKLLELADAGLQAAKRRGGNSVGIGDVGSTMARLPRRAPREA